jgi:ADP-ribose pyrophosphatase YjhB (NUDIX family)
MYYMTRRISVRGIILHQGKLLCVRLKAYKGSVIRDNSYWCLPGGGLDEGESLVAGLEREMLEETGVKATVGNLMYIQQFIYEGREFLEFFFQVTNDQDYLAIDLSKSTHGAAELEEIDFVDPASTHILPTLLTTEPLEKHAATGITKIISQL